MKRIFSSMAALAFLTVVGIAQDQTVIVSSDGKTVTINGKVHKIEPGKPLTIQGKDGKVITVNGNTVRVTASGNPVMVRSAGDKNVTVVGGGQRQLILDGNGNLVRVQTEVAQGKDPVVVSPRTIISPLSTTQRVTTYTSPIVVDGGKTVRAGISTPITTRTLRPVIVQGSADDKEIQELSRKIAELNKQLQELIQKKHGGKMLVQPGMGSMFLPKMDEKAMKVNQEQIKKLLEQNKMMWQDAGKTGVWTDKQHKELIEKLYKQGGAHKLDDKQHMELFEKLNMQGGVYKFDEKQHKELMEKLHKEFANKEHFKFEFNDKEHQKMMEKLHKEFGQKEFKFEFDDKMHKELLEKFGKGDARFYRIEPGTAPRVFAMPRTGRKGTQKDQESKRFFDEPMFRTPEPKKQSGGKVKVVAPRAKQELIRFRTEAVKEADLARKEVAIARQEALKHKELALKEADLARKVSVAARADAMKEAQAALRANQGALARLNKERVALDKGLVVQEKALKAREDLVRFVPSNDAAVKELRSRIAALEEQLKTLKEENARLKKSKNPPPPKVEVKSKRIR